MHLFSILCSSVGIQYRVGGVGSGEGVLNDARSYSSLHFFPFLKLFMFATGLGLYSCDPDSCRHARTAAITFLIEETVAMKQSCSQMLHGRAFSLEPEREKEREKYRERIKLLSILVLLFLKRLNDVQSHK